MQAKIQNYNVCQSKKITNLLGIIFVHSLQAKTVLGNPGRALELTTYQKRKHAVGRLRAVDSHPLSRLLRNLLRLLRAK